jgi:hypothetical protein
MYSTNKDIIFGSFEEKDFGAFFEYAGNTEVVVAAGPRGKLVEFPHKVYVGHSINDRGWRSAYVLETVAYVIVDENHDGLVVEKWDIKKHRKYFV